MREGVPFSLKSIKDIITEEQEELLSLIYEEVEDDLNYRVKLDIEVQLTAKLQEKEYEENWFSCILTDKHLEHLLEKIFLNLHG